MKLRFLASGILLAGAIVAPSAAHPVACSEHSIKASAIQTPSELEAFVQCAAELVREAGMEEAYRAFHEDPRWQHGQYYIFVGTSARSRDEYRVWVFPPDPSRENVPWVPVVDHFGTDLLNEIPRIVNDAGAGWAYYTFTNPADGRVEPKRSYVMGTEWNGEPAFIGAGSYLRDLPGTCEPGEVNAANLEANPSNEALQEFVRCAAFVAESQGFAAKQELESSSRWNQGSIYIYAMDTMGNQVLTGNKVRVNGQALHEWGGRSNSADQFGGRDMISVGETFGEAYLYYRAPHPLSGAVAPKTAIVKRVTSGGVPLLVGAGYYPAADAGVGEPPCADNTVTAEGVGTREEMRALVQCAVELVEEAGTTEAYRAFHEDERWRHGQYYIFVDGAAPTGDDSVAYVFPPDATRESQPWGPLVDQFGTDLVSEFDRALRGLNVPGGWIYYAFGNPATGRDEPKASYARLIDWDGNPAYIGAGIYETDLPGTCDASEVNATRLEADPGEEELRALVRCAALRVESMGLYAAPMLQSDPRWNTDSIYFFAVHAETGEMVFSGDPASLELSGRIPEALFGGRDEVSAASTFGEMHWYYTFRNPATGNPGTRVAFAKAVRAHGMPLLLVSGYYLD